MTMAKERNSAAWTLRFILCPFFILRAAWFMLRPNWTIEFEGETFFLRGFLWQPPEHLHVTSVCWGEAALVGGLYLAMAYLSWVVGRRCLAASRPAADGASHRT